MAYANGERIYHHPQRPTVVFRMDEGGDVVLRQLDAVIRIPVGLLEDGLAADFQEAVQGRAACPYRETCSHGVTHLEVHEYERLIAESHSTGNYLCSCCGTHFQAYLDVCWTCLPDEAKQKMEGDGFHVMAMVNRENS